MWPRVRAPARGHISGTPAESTPRHQRQWRETATRIRRVHHNCNDRALLGRSSSSRAQRQLDTRVPRLTGPRPQGVSSRDRHRKPFRAMNAARACFAQKQRIRLNYDREGHAAATTSCRPANAAAGDRGRKTPKATAAARWPFGKTSRCSQASRVSASPAPGGSRTASTTAATTEPHTLSRRRRTLRGGLMATFGSDNWRSAPTTSSR